MRDRAIRVAPVQNKGDGQRGHHKARAQEAQRVRSSAMTKAEERDKETSDSGRQVRQKDSQLRNPMSVTGQAQACQEKKVDLLVTVIRRVAVSNTRITDCWHPPFCVLHNRGECRPGTTCPLVRISNDDPSPSLTRQPHADKKASNKARKEGRRNLLACSRGGAHPRSREGSRTPDRQSIDQPTTRGSLSFKRRITVVSWDCQVLCFL